MQTQGSNHMQSSSWITTALTASSRLFRPPSAVHHLQWRVLSTLRPAPYTTRLQTDSLSAVASTVLNKTTTTHQPLFSQHLFTSHHTHNHRTLSTAATASSTPTNLVSTSTSYLDALSPEQLEAVTAPLGATRVIAGPGSGKTRVLTSRIGHLIHHYNAQPWQIVAITFTNKAASEMKERLHVLLGAVTADQLFAGTFHSLAYRILRRGLGSLPNSGRKDGWSLYDEDAARSVLYKLVDADNPEWKASDVKEKGKKIYSSISSIKNSLVLYGLTKDEVVDAYYRKEWGEGELTEGQKVTVKEVTDYFERYEEAMRVNNALDFDDLLAMSVALLRQSPEVRQRLRRKFRHILCDEFQDTNNPQYELLKLLTGVENNTRKTNNNSGNDSGSGSTPTATTQNMTSSATTTSGVDTYSNGTPIPAADLFVVGDPDQAIYGWRGADVKNMRNEFSTDFPTATTFFLRDNYRSSARILEAAQEVIKNNKDWDRLSLSAKLPPGSKIEIRALSNNHEEADYIADQIEGMIKGGGGGVSPESFAVLFRTHMQVKVVEKELVARNIPYVIVGGLPFWRRVEIQDMMAYIKLAVSLDDPVALDRVINVPKRGLGPATIAKLAVAAEQRGVSLCSLILGNSGSTGTTTKGTSGTGSDTNSIGDASTTSSSTDTHTTNTTTNTDTEDVLPDAKILGISTKTHTSLTAFRHAVHEMRHVITTTSLHQGISSIIQSTLYEEYVKEGGCGGKDGEEAERLERLRQLIVASKEFVVGELVGRAIDDAFDVDFSGGSSSSSSVGIGGTRDSSSSSFETTTALTGGTHITTTTTTTTKPTAVHNGGLDFARAFLDEAALYSSSEDSDKRPGVKLMTMHAAKGLEFDIVIVPGLVERLVPLYRPETDSIESLQEETRLFFVSMTRARKQLLLTTTEKTILHGGKTVYENDASRFIEDVCASGHADYTVVSSGDDDGGGDYGYRNQKYNNNNNNNNNNCSNNTAMANTYNRRKWSKALDTTQQQPNRKKTSGGSSSRGSGGLSAAAKLKDSNFFSSPSNIDGGIAGGWGEDKSTSPKRPSSSGSSEKQLPPSKARDMQQRRLKRR